MYFKNNKDNFEDLGKIELDEKLVDRVAENIHPDWLSDCTDAEWDVFDTAWRDTLKDMQKEKAEEIKNRAVNATPGVDAKTVLKEAKEKKKDSAQHAKETPESGLNRER